MSLLDIKDLSHSFGDKQLFKETEFQLNKGEHIGIVGPNGAGKSTLLKMICGILKPTSGKIEFSNHKWSRNDLSYIGTLSDAWINTHR